MLMADARFAKTFTRKTDVSDRKMPVLSNDRPLQSKD